MNRTRDSTPITTPSREYFSEVSVSLMMLLQPSICVAIVGDGWFVTTENLIIYKRYDRAE